MESTIGSHEAGTLLPRLLERVSKGERITITEHGEPVAVLAPPPSASTEKPDVRAAVEEMRRFRKGRALDGPTIREMVEEGRRF